MRHTWMLAGVLLWLALPPAAQKNKREPLTEAQQEQIAEAGLDPAERVSLYTKFVNERADVIKNVAGRHETGRGRRIGDELQDFTALIDELASNLDEYGDRKADLRRTLKPLNESIGRWQALLRGLPGDPFYDVSLHDAADAVGDLADDARRLAAEQEAYFNLHTDTKGQQREEPK